MSGQQPKNVVFVFDELQHLALLRVVLGRDTIVHQPAKISGFRAIGDRAPVGLIAEQDSEAHGILITLKNRDEALRVLQFTERTGAHYEKRHSIVETLDGPFEAIIFVPMTVDTGGATFDFEAWQSRFGALETQAAKEAIKYLKEDGSRPLRQVFSQMRFRAASPLRAAKQSKPTSLRHHEDAKKTHEISSRRPYTNFFSVDERVFRFPKFDGQLSAPVERAAFVGGDAVIVLPYDPKLDRVLLIEQFRFGAYVRGEPHPWVLEAPAGRIDPGETPEAAAKRELLEETGISSSKLHPMSSYYPTPGTCTEYLYSYVAVCDLDDDVAGIGGLESEDEDIRSHVVDFTRAMQLVASGEVDCGPLLLCLYWLENRRKDLAGIG